MNKKRALCIVAHPDDETIWMGGMILKNLELKWTIFSLCRKSDKDREPKFKKVCENYRAKPIICNLDDELLKPIEIKKITNLINNKITIKNYDYIFTHGKNGEYGHIRHKEIHKAVKMLVKNNKLKCKKLYFFSYIPGNEIAPHNYKLKIPIADKNSDLVIKLNENEYKTKVNIIKNIYGFNEGIFETIACKKMEAFNLLK
ncbi:MAG: PIG-L family deacetylase [Candidatus Pacearchaeota archaeon]